MECPQPRNVKDKATGKMNSYPCGTCDVCKKGKSNEWAGRLYIESQRAEKTYFITLTYNQKSLPINKYKIPTIKYEDIQLFMKKVRKIYKIKYAIGLEYGSEFLRPHYHIIMFVYEKTNDLEFYQKIKTKWDKGYINFKQAELGEMYYTINYIGKNNKYTDYLIDKKIIEPTGLKYSKGIGNIDIKEIIKYYEGEGINSIHKHKISRYWKNKIKSKRPKWYKKEWERRYKEYIIDQLFENKILSPDKKREEYKKMIKKNEERKKIKKWGDFK